MINLWNFLLDKFPEIPESFPKLFDYCPSVILTLSAILQNFPNIAEDYGGRCEDVSTTTHFSISCSHHYLV